ncbi:MAG: TIGR00180 family glycosyltransferase [Proteobacteria bacterium]|nr:TIGR00180 family glycosyltransferase [Pseudomonadota bacterium]
MDADLTFIEDLKDLTVFIPTHERPGYLARILAYWLHYGMTPRVVVCDSSQEPFAMGAGFPGLRYFHFPGAPYVEKVARCLAEVGTPYVVFNADDDFLAPRAVGECVRFLEQNPDHASAQGRQAVFSVEGDRLRFKAVYRDNSRMNVDSNDPAQRISQAFSPYMNQFYAVHCTENLRDFFAHARENGIRYPILLEILLSLVSAARGRHRILDVFYYAREQVADSGGSRYKRLDLVLASSELRDECRAMVRLAGQFLARASGMGQPDAEAAVGRALDAYLENLPPAPGGFSRVKSRLRGALPEALVRAVRAGEPTDEDFSTYLAGFGPGAREDLAVMAGHIRAFRA